MCVVVCLCVCVFVVCVCVGVSCSLSHGYRMWFELLPLCVGEGEWYFILLLDGEVVVESGTNSMEVDQ